MSSSKNKKWTDDEIKIIKKYYIEYGTKKCSEITGRSRRACSDMAKKLNIRFDNSFKWKEEKIRKIVNESLNISQCLKKMNLSIRPGNYSTFYKYVENYDIDVSHFEPYNLNLINNFQKTPIEKILVKDSTFSTTHLKKRLYKEGLKERVCEICGQDENWKGVKISLILDHINGMNNDHRLENLRIVCPNCNAGLKTHCVGNRKYKKKRYYCSCGNEISKGAKKCKECSSVNQRKVERPSYEQLLKDIEETNYSTTGRKYSVSDNTIRKWIKKYELDTKKS